MEAPDVKEVYASEQVYTLEDFEEAEPSTDVGIDLEPEDLPDDFLDQLSDRLRSRVVEGVKRGGKRSDQEFSTARNLLAAGFTLGQTLSVFLHPTWGVADKARDKGMGYAARTVAKAYDANVKAGVVPKSEQYDTLQQLVEALHWYEADSGAIKRRKEIDPDSDFTAPCIEWLRSHDMEFLRDARSDDGYIFWNGRVIPADKDTRQMKDLLYDMAKVTETSWDSRKLRESISHEARIYGRSVVLHPWISFDIIECQGYMLPDSHAGELLTFGPKGTSTAPNGTDGYLLRPSLLSLPVEYNAATDKQAGLQLLVDGITPLFACTRPAQQLLTCWMLSVPLQSFSSADLLPILHITGASGAGKSWVLKLMTAWFYGRALLLRATQASSYAISDADPLMPLDDYEALSSEWQGRLLTGATGLVRTKMGGSNMSQAVLQEGTVSFALTSINPLPTETLRRRAMVVDVDAKRYATAAFNPTTAVNDIVSSRNTTFSAYIKLLSEDVLPAMVAGSSAANIAAIQGLIEIPENKGLGTFMSLMWLICDHMGKHVPGFSPDSFEDTITKWAAIMQLQSVEEFTERDTLLTLVDMTYQEIRNLGEEGYRQLDISPLISSSGRVIGFEGTGTQLYSTFSAVSKSKGLRFEMSSPNAVGRRFQLSTRLLEQQGWIIEAKKFSARRGWRVTRADLVVPEEENNGVPAVG